MFSIVAAIDKNRGIGLNGSLPWKIPGDMNFFKNLTMDSNPDAVRSGYGISNPKKVPDLIRPSALEKFYKTYSYEPDGRHNAVIMGRKTWESIPKKYRPLAGRDNIILSKSQDIPDSLAYLTSSLDVALRNASLLATNTYVIGGGQIYNEAIRHEECEQLWLTRINRDFGCDTFFPKFEDVFQLENQTAEIVELGLGFTYFFEQWVRK